MTTKADYTEDEWAGLVRAPTWPAPCLATSDMSFFGMMGTSALYKTMTEGNAPEAAASLIGEVVAEIEDSKDAKDKLKLPETKSSATQAAQLVHQLGLDLRCSTRSRRPMRRVRSRIGSSRSPRRPRRRRRRAGSSGSAPSGSATRSSWRSRRLRHELGVG